MAFYYGLDDCTGRRVAELWLGHRNRSYVIADDRCPVHQQIAWCWDCQTYVAAEQLRDPSEIDADEAKTREQYGWFQDTLSRPNDVQAWLIESMKHGFDEDMARLMRERAWRQSRRSPPRFLECGSTRIEPAAKRATRHPLTGMTLTVKTLYHASMRIHSLYTPEGMRISPADNSVEGV